MSEEVHPRRGASYKDEVIAQDEKTARKLKKSGRWRFPTRRSFLRVRLAPGFLAYAASPTSFFTLRMHGVMAFDD